MRDTKGLEAHSKELDKKKKEKALHRTLRNEVNIGGHGTQNYVIKRGPNKGKVASKKQ
jgi:hypothetical protein